MRSEDNAQAWGVWLVIGLSVAFAALALVNTAAMATAERRGELATIRLLGGTAGQATRMVALELAPVVLVALLAGAAIAGVAIMGVPNGVRGIPLSVPAALAGGLAAGAALLGLAAGAVTARLALRTSPAWPCGRRSSAPRRRVAPDPPPRRRQRASRARPIVSSPRTGSSTE